MKSRKRRHTPVRKRWVGIKSAVLVLFLLLNMNILLGQNISNVGSAAAPFLTLSTDPRGLAMGSTAAAMVSGIKSAIWNPAGLAEEQHSFFISHAKWLADITIKQMGANIFLGYFGHVGAYLTYLDYGQMDVRTVQHPEGTGEKFEASDFSLGLYYARNLTSRLKLGAGLKYIRQTIWHSSAATVAFDIGTIFNSPILGIVFGASISNFGGDMRLSGRDTRVNYDIDPVLTGNNGRIPAHLDTESWPLPLMMRAGISRTFSLSEAQRLILAADALYPEDNFESVNLGLEYTFRKAFQIRIGYRGVFMPDNPGGLSGGIGYAWRTENTNWMLDIAAVDYGILNNIMVFGLSLNWR